MPLPHGRLRPLIDLEVQCVLVKRQAKVQVGFFKKEFIHIFDIISLFAAELVEPNTAI